jgi:hypothetical protein
MARSAALLVHSDGGFYHIGANFEPVSDHHNLHFRKTGFRGQRQRRQISLSNSHYSFAETHPSRRASNSGLFASRREIYLTVGPLPNSLPTGKLTGNFVESARNFES